MRFVLPIVFSFLLIVVPVFAQSVITAMGYRDIPTAVHAEVDLSGQSRFNHQDRYLRGEVEFYYNQWIISEPETKQEPVMFQTPGYWSNLPSGDGEHYSKDGYASYRYVITGLTPGSTIYASKTIDAPNRTYLNGRLVSAVAKPSKERQSSFVQISSSYTSSIVVPEDGRVEYVIEIGNTGLGGLAHIGSIYLEGDEPFGVMTRVFAPIAQGFLVAAVVLLLVFVFASPDKRRTIYLGLVGLAVGAVYIFSKDSLLIYVGLFYSEYIYQVISIIALALAVVCMILYERRRKNNPISRVEMICIMAALGITTLLYPFAYGTSLEFFVLVLLATFPLYLFIRALMNHIVGRKAGLFMIIEAGLFSYLLLVALFSLDVFNGPMIIYPTYFVFIMTACIFSAGFLDIYSIVLERKDAAELERRQRNITNRALARLSSEEETLANLRLIGETYERSIKAGDRKLLSFSMLTRRRLMALRQDTISFKDECELESALLDLHKSVSGHDAILVLDIEEGIMQVPPLIFETVLDELSDQAGSEPIILSEGKDYVQLSYPASISVDRETMRSIHERASVAGLQARFRKGSIMLSRGAQ